MPYGRAGAKVGGGCPCSAGQQRGMERTCCWCAGSGKSQVPARRCNAQPLLLPAQRGTAAMGFKHSLPQRAQRVRDAGAQLAQESHICHVLLGAGVLHAGHHLPNLHTGAHGPEERAVGCLRVQARAEPPGRRMPSSACAVCLASAQSRSRTRVPKNSHAPACAGRPAGSCCRSCCAVPPPQPAAVGVETHSHGGVQGQWGHVHVPVYGGRWACGSFPKPELTHHHLA